MKRVHVIGLGLGTQDITPPMAKIIDQAEVLAGGRRLLAWLPRHKGIRIELSGGLQAWLEKVTAAAQDKRVAVLAAGDPGFFGVARILIEHLGADNVTMVPNVSAMQAACARLNLPWGGSAQVSLHAGGGQGLADMWRAMTISGLVSVYTRPGLGPAEIAAALYENDMHNWRMHVLENLGASDERLGCYEPCDAVDVSFSPLNVVLLERTGTNPPLRLGLPEASYDHDQGLITKAEVRAVTLAKLQLGPGMTLWDVGAGSGSLGLEASLLMPGGRIVALEQKPGRVAMIKANRRKFGVGMLEIVRGTAPAALRDLPDPHRVFVGGGGRDLADIIQNAAERLQPGGIIVVNAVLLESMATARASLRQAGLALDQALVQISHGSPVAGQTMMKALNPVWLLRGRMIAKNGQND